MFKANDPRRRGKLRHTQGRLQGVPIPAYGGTVFCALVSTGIRTAALLPYGNDRVRAIRWPVNEKIEVMATPTDDGTSSLVCVG